MSRQLRGHHLMCALGFRGHGYSPAFAANMADILAALDRAPETPVQVVDVPDGICAAFPADQPGHCLEADVVERDRRVIARVGLNVGDVLTWRELRRRLGAAFSPADLDGLCTTCRWLPLGFCREGLAALQSTSAVDAGKREMPGASAAGGPLSAAGAPDATGAATPRGAPR